MMGHVCGLIMATRADVSILNGSAESSTKHASTNAVQLYCFCQHRTHSAMDTIKNVVASVNEGVASMAQSAQQALGTVHDKAAESAQTGPQKVDEVRGDVG